MRRSALLVARFVPVLAVLGGVLAACSSRSAPARVLVLVRSDYTPVTELAEVEAQRVSPTRETHKRRVVASHARDGESVTMPFSFSVEPPDGDASQRVELVISARDPSGHTLVRRRLRVGFVPHESRLLRIDLTRDCAALYASCEPAQTCDHGACIAIDVDVRKLPRVSPGDELNDAGPLDCTTCELPDTGTSNDGATSATDASDAAMLHDGSPTHGDSGGTDSSDDDAGQDGDAGALPIDCGRQSGFFADLGYALHRTGDDVLCTVIGQNAFNDELGSSAENNASRALESSGYAIAANYDFLHFDVTMKGSTLYVSGSADPTDFSKAPALSTMLSDTTLAGDTRPLLLVIKGNLQISGAADFATAMLELLASPTGAAFAAECRPLYVLADGSSVARDAVLAMHEALQTDPDYAALRRYVHFGTAVSPSISANGIEQIDAQVFELALVDYVSPGLLATARRLRAHGMVVFLRGFEQPGLAPALCGFVDGMFSNAHAWTGGTTSFAYDISSSRRLLRLDTSGADTQATKLSYFSQGGGASTQVTLSGSVPSLSSGLASAALPDTFLDFSASSSQSLALSDADPPLGSRRFAGMVFVRLPATAALPQGTRQVIISKKDAQSGWALSLINESGAPQLRYETFLRDGAPSFALHVETLEAPLASLSTSTSYAIVFGLPVYSELFVADLERNGADGLGDTSVEQNDLPVTLGADPGASGDFFDGDLQALQLITY